VHVSLTRATIAAEERHRWLRDIEGFRGMLMLSREGTTLGLTFWESEEIVDYELMFARLGPLLTDPTT
jgi:hypothetical protein